MKSDIMSAIQQICEEKNISYEAVLETIEAALAAAYRKDFGTKNMNVKVEYNPENGDTRVYDVKTVVEDISEEELEKAAELRFKEKEGEEIDEEIKKFNPKTEIMLSEAKELKKSAKIGEEIITELEVPEGYGRMAAQTAKQVIIQRIREAERDTIFNEFKDKENTIVSGIVQRREGRVVLIDLGQAVGVLIPEGQIEGENYYPGRRIKVFVSKVELTARGPEIVVSRSHPEIVRELFRTEVPEINNGSVEIKNIAREAGYRTKIAVSSKQDNIDPVGSCVGQRGSRVQTIINELEGEKVDIIEWSDDPEKFITNALSPAKVNSLDIDEENKTAVAHVKLDQYSLAIGRAGQNVRLAAKLTGWKIDVEGGDDQKLTKDAETADGGEKPAKETEKEGDSQVKEKKKIVKEVKKEEEEKTVDKKEEKKIKKTKKQEEKK